MKVKELDKWFSIKEYDPEDKELPRILEIAKVKDKNVLVIGIYGVIAIAPKLLKYAKSVTAICSNRHVIAYCKKKTEKINFQVGNITDLKFQDKTFDVIISPWGGLHYQRNKPYFTREFKRILKDKGIVLIEESDETSEFVKILNLVAPKRKSKIRKKRDELKRNLNKEFRVAESRLSTYYDFKNKGQFIDYFKKEIIFDENKKFTERMQKKLRVYISKKRILKVGEKSIFFICRKR